MGILAAAAFTLRSKYHMTKRKSPGHIVFGRDMIVPMNNITDWIYTRQRKQAQIDKDVIQEKTTKIDHYYRVEDKLTRLTKSAYKYETLHRGPYKIVQTWTNRRVTLRMVAVTTRINIHNIKLYNAPIVEGKYPA